MLAVQMFVGLGYEGSIRRESLGRVFDYKDKVSKSKISHAHERTFSSFFIRVLPKPVLFTLAVFDVSG